ncbi:aegerolysin family protein [Vibrio parahaemolyticus]|nr:hypothetical protein [Vibrio parahaemolyticus]HCH6158894.1 hypothetical protein [Vibrio parahaemolyticus]
MAYAQWVSYTVIADNCNLTVKNAQHSWGKFYRYDNKDDELSPDDVNGQVVEIGQEGFNIVSSCDGTRLRIALKRFVMCCL